MKARLDHSMLAIALTFSLLIAPCASAQTVQDQDRGGTVSAAPTTQDSAAATSQLPAAANTAVAQDTTPAVGRDLRSTWERDYSKPPKAFPDFTAPYREVKLPRLDLSNSPRIENLIQNGKLTLSLDDAITLALENNLNINVARYTPWLAEDDVLRSKSGQPFLGTQTIAQPFGLGNVPFLSFDPALTTQVSDTYAVIPVNNPFLAGVGTTAVIALTAHQLQETIGYSQGFHTGTDLTVNWNNTRQSSSSPENVFNPSFQGNVTVTVSQQLLNGFGTIPNTRYIVEAKNERQAADYYFATQVIATVQTTETAYWELVYARENVKVQEAALATSTKLYNDKSDS